MDSPVSSKYPRQSVWDALNESFLEVELEEIKKFIGSDLISSSLSLWSELYTLKEIIQDIHSFELKQENNCQIISQLSDKMSLNLSFSSSPTQTSDLSTSSDEVTSTFYLYYYYFNRFV